MRGTDTGTSNHRFEPVSLPLPLRLTVAVWLASLRLYIALHSILISGSASDTTLRTVALWLFQRLHD